MFVLTRPQKILVSDWLCGACKVRLAAGSSEDISHYAAKVCPGFDLSDSFACLSAHTEGLASARAGR